ncbi:hypothetical protein D0911_14055 [Zhongshania marina]|uniref:Lipoprotein n=2 Tax=Zhongshania marina TaxID=2304603 RepID=A0ABX9VZW4_9GAMM|nr:hypothetical protein D0911_14055 [Zhongshania marina]
MAFAIAWQQYGLSNEEMEFNMGKLNSTRVKLLTAGLLSASLIVACGSDKDADPVTVNDKVQTEFSTVAALGALEGAVCTVFNSSDVALGSATTDEDGKAAFSFLAAPSDFPFVVSCEGGDYYDESTQTKKTLPAGKPILSMVPEPATVVVNKNIAVNTLTDMSTAVFKTLPKAQQNAEGVVQSLNNTVKAIAPELVKNGGGLNVLEAPTVVKNATDKVPATPAGKYAAVLAGIAKAATASGKTPDQLGKELAEQAKTGTIVAEVIVQVTAKTKEFAQEQGDEGLEEDLNDDEEATGTVVKPNPTPTPPPTTGGTGTST